MGTVWVIRYSERIIDISGVQLQRATRRLSSSTKQSDPRRDTTGPPIQWVPTLKRQGIESERSHTSNVKFKNEWSYTFTPPYALRTCTGATLSVELPVNGDDMKWKRNRKKAIQITQHNKINVFQ